MKQDSFLTHILFLFWHRYRSVNMWFIPLKAWLQQQCWFLHTISNKWAKYHKMLLLLAPLEDLYVGPKGKWQPLISCLHKYSILHTSLAPDSFSGLVAFGKKAIFLSRVAARRWAIWWEWKRAAWYSMLSQGKWAACDVIIRTVQSYRTTETYCTGFVRLTCCVAHIALYKHICRWDKATFWGSLMLWDLFRYQT